MNPVDRFVNFALTRNSDELTTEVFNECVDVPLVTALAHRLGAVVPACELVLAVETDSIPAFALSQVLGVPLVLAGRKNGYGRNRIHVNGKGYLHLPYGAIHENTPVLILESVFGDALYSLALKQLVETEGAHVVGIATYLEKTFDVGRNRLEVHGIPVYPLARIAKLASGFIAERRRTGYTAEERSF